MDLHETALIDGRALDGLITNTVLLSGRYVLYDALVSALPRMDPMAHPLDQLLTEAHVAAQVKTTEGLRLAKQPCDEDDSRCNETTTLNIQVGQLCIIFYEVLEAGNDFEVELLSSPFSMPRWISYSSSSLL